MAIDIKLATQTREKTGSSECRRLRRQGLVPGNIYGHGREATSFSVAADVLLKTVTGGHHVIELDINGQPELAMFRQVQWDTFGTYIQHIDMIIVSRDEKVQVAVPVVLRGIAVGTQSGGLIDHQMRTLAIECPAFSIPDSISVRIGSLEIGDSIAVKDIELPEDSVVQDDPEAIIVQVNEPAEEVDLEEGTDLGPAEPEVIGRSADDEESDS
jgi:large subunit ribosomal protein L25